MNDLIGRSAPDLSDLRSTSPQPFRRSPDSVMPTSLRTAEADIPGSADRRTPRGGGEGASRVAARRNQRPNGSRNGAKEKIAGTRSDPGDCNRLNFKTSKERAMGLEPTTSSLGSVATRTGALRNAQESTLCGQRASACANDLAQHQASTVPKAPRCPERLPSSASIAAQAGAPGRAPGSRG